MNAQDHKGAVQLSFTVTDDKNPYFQAFAHSVHQRTSFCLDLPLASKIRRGLPRIDEEAAHDVLIDGQEGQFVWFRLLQVRNQDSIADDSNEWNVVLCAEKDLEKSVLAGGMTCYLLLTYRGSSPPNSALKVVNFASFKARKRGGQIAFEIDFVHAGGQAFPIGGGKLVGLFQI